MKAKILVQSMLWTVLGLSLAGPMYAQSCWTVAGTTGTVDEENLGQVSMANGNLQVLSTAPLPAGVTSRFSVTGLPQDTGAVKHYWTLSARYKDNGNPDARVQLLFHSQNLFTSAFTNLALLDSDVGTQSSGLQTLVATSSCVLGGGFDFFDNTYFIEAALTKNTAAGSPILQVLQVCVFDC
ncbi:MAG TPA: hypothetical protein VIE43_11610 [Thermoanaerobaculia bacterium]|jgi:hypothetical protein|nr:hypothetical protein [Thermoanaerobaculia bacterium]